MAAGAGTCTICRYYLNPSAALLGRFAHSGFPGVPPALVRRRRQRISGQTDHHWRSGLAFGRAEPQKRRTLSRQRSLFRPRFRATRDGERLRLLPNRSLRSAVEGYGRRRRGLLGPVRRQWRTEISVHRNVSILSLSLI